MRALLGAAACMKIQCRYRIRWYSKDKIFMSYKRLYDSMKRNMESRACKVLICARSRPINPKEQDSSINLAYRSTRSSSMSSSTGGSSSDENQSNIFPVGPPKTGPGTKPRMDRAKDVLKIKAAKKSKAPRENMELLSPSDANFEDQKCGSGDENQKTSLRVFTMPSESEQKNLSGPPDAFPLGTYRKYGKPGGTAKNELKSSKCESLKGHKMTCLKIKKATSPQEPQIYAEALLSDSVKLNESNLSNPFKISSEKPPPKSLKMPSPVVETKPQKRSENATHRTPEEAKKNALSKLRKSVFLFNTISSKRKMKPQEKDMQQSLSSSLESWDSSRKDPFDDGNEDLDYDRLFQMSKKQMFRVLSTLDVEEVQILLNILEERLSKELGNDCENPDTVSSDDTVELNSHENPSSSKVKAKSQNAASPKPKHLSLAEKNATSTKQPLWFSMPLPGAFQKQFKYELEHPVETPFQTKQNDPFSKAKSKESPFSQVQEKALQLSDIEKEKIILSLFMLQEKLFGQNKNKTTDVTEKLDVDKNPGKQSFDKAMKIYQVKNIYISAKSPEQSIADLTDKLKVPVVDNEAIKEAERIINETISISQIVSDPKVNVDAAVDTPIKNAQPPFSNCMSHYEPQNPDLNVAKETKPPQDENADDKMNQEIDNLITLMEKGQGSEPPKNTNDSVELERKIDNLIALMEKEQESKPPEIENTADKLNRKIDNLIAMMEEERGSKPPKDELAREFSSKPENQVSKIHQFIEEKCDNEKALLINASIDDNRIDIANNSFQNFAKNAAFMGTTTNSESPNDTGCKSPEMSANNNTTSNTSQSNMGASFPLFDAFPKGRNPCRDGSRESKKGSSNACGLKIVNPCLARAKVEEKLKKTKAKAERAVVKAMPATKIKRPRIIKGPEISAKVSPKKDPVATSKMASSPAFKPKNPKDIPKSTHTAFPLFEAFPKGRNPCRDGPQESEESCPEAEEKDACHDPCATVKRDPCKAQTKKVDPCKAQAKKAVDPCKAQAKKVENPCQAREKVVKKPKEIKDKVERAVVKHKCARVVKGSAPAAKPSPKKQPVAAPAPSNRAAFEVKAKNPKDIPKSTHTAYPLFEAFPKGRNPCRDGPQDSEESCPEPEEKDACHDPCPKIKTDPCKAQTKKVDPCKAQAKKAVDPCKAQAKRVENPCQAREKVVKKPKEIKDKVERAVVKHKCARVVKGSAPAAKPSPKKQPVAAPAPSNAAAFEVKSKNPKDIPKSTHTAFPLFEAFPKGRNPCRDGPQESADTECEEEEVKEVKNPCGMKILNPCLGKKQKDVNPCQAKAPAVKKPQKMEAKAKTSVLKVMPASEIKRPKIIKGPPKSAKAPKKAISPKASKPVIQKKKPPESVVAKAPKKDAAPKASKPATQEKKSKETINLAAEDGQFDVSVCSNKVTDVKPTPKEDQMVLAQTLRKALIGSCPTEFSVCKKDSPESSPEDKAGPLRYPVAPLEKTLEGYLASVKPLVTKEQFTKEQKLAKEFLKSEGNDLQRFLQEAAAQTCNWLTPRWVNAAYLSYKAPLTVFSSPGLAFPIQNFDDKEEYLKFTANAIRAIFEFKNLVSKNEIPVTKLGKYDLDNSQFSRIFGTTRLPQRPCDRIVQYLNSQHVVIIHRNNFFKLCVCACEGGMIHRDCLMDQLEDILNCKIETGDPIGLLTHDNRDNWAEAYGVLASQPGNFDIMKEIEEALFVVCLDTFVPLKKGQESVQQVYQLFHGGGLGQNSGNRWMDKTIQLIINPNGMVGFCYEHSPADCQPLATLMDFVQTKMMDPEFSRSGEQKIKAAHLLRFKPVEDCVNLWLCEAKRNISKIVNMLQVDVLDFDCHGKDFINGQGLAVDSYIQMALQLAFYRMYGTLPAQYESAHLRVFKEGRTETIRSTSMESKTFVETITSPRATIKEKMLSLQLAVDAHQKLSQEALQGNGIDRHLFGLQQMAIERKQRLPDFFRSKGFVRSVTFDLFTSHVATNSGGFMAFGPLISNGYGIGYNPQKNKIVFAITTWQSSLKMSAPKFAKALKVSLEAMGEIVLKSCGDPIGKVCVKCPED